MEWTEAVAMIQIVDLPAALAEHLGTTTDDERVVGLLEFAGTDRGRRASIDGFETPEHTDIFWTDHHEKISTIVQIMADYFDCNVTQMISVSSAGTLADENLGSDLEKTSQIFHNVYPHDDKVRSITRLCICMMALRVAGDIYVNGDSNDPKAYG